LETKGEKNAENCFHCKDKILGEELIYDEKKFCCTGCRNVYKVLKENQLEDYYEIDAAAGVSMKGEKNDERFAFLDDPVIVSRICDFRDGSLAKLTFYVPQIHCASCVWLLEKLPQFNPGYLRATVNFMKRTVSLSLNTDLISVRQAVEQMSAIGYEPIISMDDLEKKRAPKTDRKFLYKLGVSGFCWGNIMLLSFPEYLGIDEIHREYANVFGYANLILSLPVFFYGSLDYHVSAFHALRHKGINIDVPLSLGIFALFFRSAYEILSETGAGYMDSLASLIFLLLIGKWFQQKTFDHINFERDYKSYFPIAVTTETKAGERKTVPLSNVKIGDTIIVRNGELVPADAVLLEGDARIDYSFVTGESAPVRKKTGDAVYAGGRQTGGIIRLQLTKDVSQSYLTQLWNEHRHENKQGQNFQSLTNKLSYRFTIIILLLATAGAIFWSQTSLTMSVNVFTAVLIIACPCALALNVPFTLGNALRILSGKGFFAKDTDVIERTVRLTDVVFDKTGTITHSAKQKIEFFGEMSETEKNAVRALAYQSNHPLSRQIFAFFKKKGETVPPVENFEEKAGAGITGLVGGVSVKIGKAEFVGAEETGDLQIFKTRSYVAVGGRVCGVFVFEQEAREGVAEMIGELKKSYRLHLLSGDNDAEKKRMEVIFGEDADLHFRQSPQDKMDFIKSLKEKNAFVMMLGDGLNDAGALMQADVGVAVSDDVNQFSPACDMIVAGESTGELAKMIGYCRDCVKMVRFGFLLSLAYNVVGVSIALTGNLSPIWAAVLMPLSSVTVVLSGIAGTSFFAKKLSE
jgi:Cu+-exporting ATPase